MRLLPASLLISLFLVLLPSQADAASCMNKFVFRSEGHRQHLTLLTGMMTFQEAQILAKSISDKKTAPLQWVDDKGRVIAKQFGELKAVRPMPVGCEGKRSGVVLNATFMTPVAPAKRMVVKFNDSMTVQFEEQAK